MEENNHFDLIINGTGIIESIVACAASKSGLSVLHLDKNDYYGRNHASFSLECLLSNDRFQHHDHHRMELFLSNSQLPMEPVLEPIHTLSRSLKEATRILSSFCMPFPAKKTAIPNVLHPACAGSSMSSGDVSLVTTDSVHPIFLGYQQDEYKRTLMAKALKGSRYFNIDVTSKMLMSAGDFVDCLIQSGVSKYLEFKAIEGVYYWSGSKSCLSVPCSKSDVFNSKLLSVMEKRLLMKFLQQAADYGKTALGTEVRTLNEHELAQGRALHRPQNKDPNSVASIQPGDESFQDFMTLCKLPPRLQSIVTHALCLHLRGDAGPAIMVDISCSETTRVAGLKASEGLKKLAAHMNSIGKFGDTAFLTTMYGLSELVQAFCRCCAVWGGIYMLRSSIRKLVLLPDSLALSDRGETSVPDEEECSSIPTEIELSPVPSEVHREDKGDEISKVGNVYGSDADGPTLTTITSQGPCATSVVVTTLSPEESCVITSNGDAAVKEGGEGEEEDSPQLAAPPRESRKVIEVVDGTGQRFTSSAFLCAVEEWPTPVWVRSALVTRISVIDKPVLPQDR